MFDKKQVDTSKEEQLYMFSAVEHVPKAAGRVGVALNNSAQVSVTWLSVHGGNLLPGASASGQESEWLLAKCT